MSRSRLNRPDRGATSIEAKTNALAATQHAPYIIKKADNRLHKYTGSDWLQLGVSTDTAIAITASNDDMYHLNGTTIYKWDNTATPRKTPLVTIPATVPLTRPNTPIGTIRQIEINNQGGFLYILDKTGKIFKYNVSSSSWSVVTSPGNVTDIAAGGQDYLYALLKSTSTSQKDTIKRYDGTSWTTLTTNITNMHSISASEYILCMVEGGTQSIYHHDGSGWSLLDTAHGTGLKTAISGHGMTTYIQGVNTIMGDKYIFKL